MMRPSLAVIAPRPALRRLADLAPLEPRAVAALTQAIDQAQTVRARTDLIVEGAVPPAPRLLVSGWAARVRILADGRRQFLAFFLPGDLIGQASHPRAAAAAAVTALTDVATCPAPAERTCPSLADVYAEMRALEEARLLAHIVRLGRMGAQERIVDLLLELAGRLHQAGLAGSDGFDMPLTQEMLGDTLGLTSVHINRTLQQCRRDGTLTFRGGRLILHDAAALAGSIDHRPYATSPRRVGLPETR